MRLALNLWQLIIDSVRIELNCRMLSWYMRILQRCKGKPKPESLGFPDGSVAKNLPSEQETQEAQVQSLIGKIPRRGTWQPMDRGACGLQSVGSHRVKHR